MNSDWQWLVAIYPDYRTDADSVGALSQDAANGVRSNGGVHANITSVGTIRSARYTGRNVTTENVE